MHSIPRFNEGAMVISEGRMLSAEDETSCVVSQYFLDAYGLNIGDKLTIELGDRLFEQNAQKGAITYIPERRWNPIETVELEIVGAYYDTDPDYERNAEHYWGYSPNTIFVPLSLLPITPPADHEIKPGEFSLLVENVRNIPAFLEAAEALAAEMGLTLRFSDGNWENIQEHLTVSVRASLITAVLYILGAVLALLLAVYLFVWRNKHTYAIMRALGVPCKKVNNWLSLPLGVLSVLAVPIGGVVGLVYTMQVISREYITDTSLPVGSIILCFVLELAFIALIAMFFLRRLAKKPPLELLQGDIIRVADIANVEALVGRTPTPTPTKQATIQFVPAFNDLPQRGKYSAFRQVTAYILKHISRVKWKTAISLTLAIVLTGALGVLTLTRYSYQELFKTVDVVSTVTAFNSHAIDELLQSELARDLYFYSDFDVAINLREVDNPHTITNDIERYLQGDYTIEYANGFSSEIFQGTDALCVLGSFAAETLEVEAGDEIILMPGGILQALNTIYYGSVDFQNTLRQSWGLMDADDEVFFERLEQEIQEQLTQASTPYRVVGIIHSEDFTTGTSVFTPAGESAVALHSLFNDDFFAVKYSQFIVGDNEKINELSAFLYELKGESREAAYFIDTAELDNIKRVWDLILLLFPVAVVGVVLIGLTAPGLIIIQSAKEAAILRVLGVTKKRARCMLMFEQIGLCIIGIALAAGGLVLYNSGLFTRSAETLAVCGVLYLLGCVCAAFGASVSVTRRRILELLQVKE
jgi:ABC-type lipoprotein release transport system permease subunit